MTWPDTFEGGDLGDGRPATATDRPHDLQGLRQVVADRVAQKLAIYPQGGCSALDYGGTPRTPGVAVDTRALNRVIDYPAADMTVTVEAGITLSALREVLAKENQRLLIDAPYADQATLGAIYATNTSGPRRFGAGRPRDQILGVGFVTSDGELVRGGGRVVKNVAGYDFPRLLTGSMGTLGVIAEMTLKVRPRPEASVLVWARYKDTESLGLALEQLNTSATRPIAVELLNPFAANVVLGKIDLSAVLYGADVKRSEIPQGTHEWALVVGFEDNAASVSWQIDQLRKELRGQDLSTIEGAEAEPRWQALTGFQEMKLGPVTIVVNSKPSSVSRIAGSLNPDDWAIQAHAGSGIMRAHRIDSSVNQGTNYVWSLEDSADSMPPESLVQEIDRIRTVAVQDGGNLILSRCPTSWKGRLRVWGEPRHDWSISERVKQALDPLGVMNPGRFVGNI